MFHGAGRACSTGALARSGRVCAPICAGRAGAGDVRSACAGESSVANTGVAVTCAAVDTRGAGSAKSGIVGAVNICACHLLTAPAVVWARDGVVRCHVKGSSGARQIRAKTVDVRASFGLAAVTGAGARGVVRGRQVHGSAGAFVVVTRTVRVTASLQVAAFTGIGAGFVLPSRKACAGEDVSAGFSSGTRVVRARSIDVGARPARAEKRQRGAVSALGALRAAPYSRPKHPSDFAMENANGT